MVSRFPDRFKEERASMCTQNGNDVGTRESDRVDINEALKGEKSIFWKEAILEEQYFVALSTVELKFIAFNKVSKKFMFLKKLTQEICHEEFSTNVKSISEI